MTKISNKHFKFSYLVALSALFLTFSIKSPSQVTVSITSTNLLCAGQCNGTATANASGGTTPYTWHWRPGNQTTQSISGLCAGNDTVVVTDHNNVTVQAIVTITQPTVLQIQGGSFVDCGNHCTGYANATVSGGVTPYTYSWSNGGTTQQISNLCTGTYTVVVHDSNGCWVSVHPFVPVFKFTGPITYTNPSCPTCCDGSLNAQPFVDYNDPSCSSYNYSWTPGGSQLPNQTNVCAGTYTCCISNNCCTLCDSATIRFPTSVPVIAAEFLSVPTILYSGQVFTIQNIPLLTKLDVYDIKGRLVYSKENYNGNMISDELPEGFYFTKLTLSSGFPSVHKLLVLH